MINFPLFPADGQQYTFDGRSWKYSTAKGVWDMVPVSSTDANYAAVQALLSKDWASKPTGTVDGSFFSARKYAQDAAASAAQAQTAVDTRKLAKWFSGGYAGKKIAWVGDSTTEQMNVGYQGLTASNGPTVFMAGVFPSLATTIERNYGAVGAMFSGFISPGPGGANSAGTLCGLDSVAAGLNDVAIVCYGINDFRGALAPGVGGVPDYRVAYGAAGNVAAALLCQTWMVETIRRLRLANPDICIIFRMPNGANTNNVNLINGVTTQQMMDVLRLAYRGDPALGVPNPESFDEGILVVDVMASMFSQVAYTTDNTLVDNPGDGLHPSAGAYRQMLTLFATLFDDPSMVTMGNNKLAAYRELSIAHGHYVLDPQVFTESGEWYKVYEGQVAPSLAFYWDLNLGPTPNSGTHAWGGAIGAGRGTTNPPGLALGDKVLWANGDIETVGLYANDNQGMARYNNNEISGSTFIPEYLNDGVAVVTHGAGSKCVIYRHKWANSVLARRNAWLAEHGTPEQQDIAFSKAYRFTVLSASNGEIQVCPVGSEPDAFGTLVHTITEDDVMCLPGIEGGVGPVDGFLGISLTGASFSVSGFVTTITLAGRDFRNYVAPQGFILSL